MCPRLASVALVVFGFSACGLGVAGTPPPPDVPDAAPPLLAPKDAGVVEARDVTPRPSCDAMGCPSGAQCTAGVCIATMTISVSVAGKSQLILRGDQAKWHHERRVPPSTMTINGTPWTPTWPANAADGCDCDSSTTTFAPAIVARQHTATMAQTAGRLPIGMRSPTEAGGYAIVLELDDDERGVYEATITYETE